MRRFFTSDESGNGMIVGLSAGAILALGIGIYFLSAVIPGALTNFFGASKSGWDAGTVALWGLIPLAIVALIVLIFVPGQNRGA